MFTLSYAFLIAAAFVCSAIAAFADGFLARNGAFLPPQRRASVI